MTKAAVASLLLLLPSAFAAVSDEQADFQRAADESVRREAFRVDLHRKLADAQIAQKKGDNFEAAKLYTDCVGLIKKIGTGVETEQKTVLAGVQLVRLQLAEQAQRSGDFTGAELQVSAILAADPKNEPAL